MKKSRHLGKKIECLYREFRSYLSPKDRRVYREIKQSIQLKSQDECRKLVLFDIHSIAIDDDAARYLLRVVCEFISLGYTPCYKDNFRFVANIKTKGFKKALLNLDHIFYNKEDKLKKYGEIKVCVSDNLRVLSRTMSPHTVYIDYECRDAKDGEVALSFGPSPVLLDNGYFKTMNSEEVNSSERLNRIFFAGRTRAREYGRGILMRDYGIMNRLEAIDVLTDYPTEGKLIADKQLGEDEWGKPHRVLIVSNDFCEIPAKHWMQVMSQSDFFLACPGSETPICHNVIECLAVGTIPIIEYPQYIKPGLVDGVHCLTFSGKDELEQCIEKALKMTVKEIEEMRLAVLEFYQNYYRAGALAELLISSDNDSNYKTLLFNNYRMKVDRD